MVAILIGGVLSDELRVVRKGLEKISFRMPKLFTYCDCDEEHPQNIFDSEEGEHVYKLYALSPCRDLSIYVPETFEPTKTIREIDSFLRRTMRQSRLISRLKHEDTDEILIELDPPILFFVGCQYKTIRWTDLRPIMHIGKYEYHRILAAIDATSGIYCDGDTKRFLDLFDYWTYTDLQKCSEKIVRHCHSVRAFTK